ncbi:MAG TPA: aldose epimerase [Stenotrophomonas sp.]|jgi:aldose 1-epimerase
MATTDRAALPLPAGECIVLRRGALEVEVAPQAGGRIAQLRHDGVAWLIGPDAGYPGAIAWGAYPMLPWAGRLRGGRFHFKGRDYEIPANLERNAIHGLAFDVPWQVEAQAPETLVLSLDLAADPRWPFGGRATHELTLQDDALRLRLSVQAGPQAMPLPVLGWHPWFRKQRDFQFNPTAYYPRDAEGIATLPLAALPGPQDDCFLNDQPIVLSHEGRTLRLSSDCDHWVYFDEQPQATCFEPQSGPPDTFNLRPDQALQPGQSAQAEFWLSWR